MGKIYVAGHRGLVGSAIVRQLIALGTNPNDILTKTHAEMDLKDRNAVDNFFSSNDIEQVYMAGAKVGGIVANNTYPAEFIYENLTMQTNVIHNAYRRGIKKLLMLGSTCIYPRECPQPIDEEYLLTGHLEKTNDAYAIAKIAGLKMCEAYHRQYGVDYRSVMPSNIYGINDNFHPENNHLVAGVIGRIYAAKQRGDRQVVIWGTGTPRREFLYCDDMARGCITVMNADKALFDSVASSYRAVNLGPGYDITINELFEKVCDIIGFKGEILHDNTRPDGTMAKLTDITRITKLDWKPIISLDEGLKRTYFWYEENLNKGIIRR